MNKAQQSSRRLAREIFSQGSNNFYTSSRFFSRAQREKVSVLYAFVRTADNFVDCVPPQIAQFDSFEKQYRALLNHDPHPHDRYTSVIVAFVALQRACQFEQEWIDAFFYSMRLDISKREYNSKAETLEYIYGSAEVVGLCMVRILHLNRHADECAKLFGRALQYINFIRDIKEDNRLGRRYLPLADGLPDLSEDTATRSSAQVAALIRLYLAQFRSWLSESKTGFEYMPPHVRVPIQTAGDVFCIIAKKIDRKPLIVYTQKVTISKLRIMMCAIKNTIVIYIVGLARHRK